MGFGVTVLGAVSLFHSVWYAFIIAPSDLFFMGSASMKFWSTSTITIMYWFPLLDVAGNRPVWSVCIVSVALCIFMYMSLIFGVAGMFVSVSSRTLVDPTPFSLTFHMSLLRLVGFWEMLSDCAWG